jgi:hypothetical protein
MEKGGHSIHESLHGLEEMVMSYLTPQVLPETFNRIELWGICRQADQFNFILMLSQKGLDRLGKMDAIIVHHDVLFAARFTDAWGNQLGEHRAKQGIVFVLTDGPEELATDPVDQPSSVLLFVLSGRLKFPLLPLLAPTAHYPWQQGEINLILIVQVNFARTSLLLQLLQASRFLLICWSGLLTESTERCTL